MQNYLKIDLKKFITPEVKSLAKKATNDFLKNYLADGGAFFDLPNDTSIADACTEFAKRSQHFKEVVILGIGGSSLGAETLVRTLGKTDTKFHFMDNIDPVHVVEVLEKISWNKTLFLVVSKSGTTPETLSQFFLVERELNKRKLPINQHLVCITDSHEGPLWEFANQSQTVHFPIPREVGGRFSALTSVGLLPAALAGIDIKKIIKGAAAVRESFLKEKEKNDIALFAAAEFFQCKKGFVNRSSMAYGEKLSTYLAWYRQLLAESIGKNEGGITPLAFTGTTDQHSELQLYLDGRKDKFFVFYHVEKFEKDTRLPKITHPKLDYLSGRKLSEIIHAEEDGTRKALQKKGLPVATISIPKISEETLGALLFMAEIEIALLGKLFKINTYDQPAVEAGKIITKKTLKRLQKK